MDTVRLTGVKAETVIGVHAWEKKVPRAIVVDVQLATDATKAAASDRIEDALDYAAIAQAVTQFTGAARVQLVETLAERLAAHLMQTFRAPWVSLTVHKPGAVPGVGGVSVSIERGKRP